MNKKIKLIIILQILLLIYSTSTIFSKLAGTSEFMSLRFIFCYGMVLFLLGVYAIGWQQIIKRLPLTTAFSNKAITVVWGIVWGLLIFKESITPGKIIGAIFVVAGVILFAYSENDNQENRHE